MGASYRFSRAGGTVAGVMAQKASWVEWRLVADPAKLVCMTEAQSQILELFRALSADERDALLPHLAEAAEDDFDDLTAEDVAAIEEGIAQAERGEVEDAEVVLDRIAARFNFPRA